MRSNEIETCKYDNVLSCWVVWNGIVAIRSYYAPSPPVSGRRKRGEKERRSERESEAEREREGDRRRETDPRIITIFLELS